MERRFHHRIAFYRLDYLYRTYLTSYRYLYAHQLTNILSIRHSYWVYFILLLFIYLFIFSYSYTLTDERLMRRYIYRAMYQASTIPQSNEFTYSLEKQSDTNSRRCASVNYAQLYVNMTTYLKRSMTFMFHSKYHAAHPSSSTR